MLLDQWISHKFLRQLEKIEFGAITVTDPDGRTHAFAGRQSGPTADLQLHQWSVIRTLLTKADTGFAQDYQRGLWDSADLIALTSFAMLNEAALASYVDGSPFWEWLLNLGYRLQANTLKGSRRNIQAHYDLGNDFYKLWLDPSMTYSSAIYQDGAAQLPLEQAQHLKYDRILERLNASSGRLLEVGCGWGGFAARALDKHDYQIKGITLSDEQHAYANDRLKQSANIVLEDYRHQQGVYDRIVSIEMFEAVGEKFWPVYFSKLASLLKSDGKAVVQTITMADDRFEKYRKGTDMIRSYIFPGGMLPSPKRFRLEAAAAGLVTTNEYHFGESYARTLEQWLHNFDARLSEIKALGYDNSFIRLWRLYLAVCVSGFRTGRTSVMQINLHHA